MHITAPAVLVQIWEEGTARDGDKDGRGGTTQASRGDAGGEDAWRLRASGAELPLPAFSGIPPCLKPSVSITLTTANTSMVPDTLPGPSRVSTHLILVTAVRW